MNKIVKLSIVASFFIVPSIVFGEQDTSKIYTLDTVDINYEEQGTSIYAKEPVNAVSTNTLTKKTLNKIGGPAQTNYLKAIDFLPGINTQTADAVGISSTQNIKVRGKSSFHIGKTIEDLPLTGIVGTNGLGGGELFDMENVGELNVYKGAVASDKGFSLSTSGGVVNANLLAPSDDFGIHLKQTLGTDSFRRTFGRVDSGKMGDSSFFLSYSNTAGDKWRGEGGSPDGKHNINFGYTQYYGDKVSTKVYAAYNKVKLHNYRSMGIEEARDFKTNYKRDFKSNLVSGASDNNLYYDYNRQEYESWATIVDLKIELASNAILTVKPHYWTEDGYKLDGNPGNKVTRWDIEHEQYGLLTKIDAYILNTDFAIGHSYLNMEAPPPPVYRKQITLNPDGTFGNSVYSTLSKQSNNILNTFFVTAAKEIDDVTISGGFKYLVWKTANLQYFKNINLISGNLSYDDAIATATPDSKETVNSQTYHRVLPNISLDYKINPMLSTAIQYSKTYGRPDWGPQAVAYQKANPLYKSKYTMQDMFDKLKPEMADNFELSATYNSDKFHFKPVLFYSKYSDKELNIFDEAAGQRYNVSSAKALAYGAEAEISYQALTELSFFCSPSYTISEYVGDTKISATKTVKTDGNQFTDVPKLLVKLGASYETQSFHISPVVRYSASRYGNAENTEKVNAYTVVDLHAGYNWKNILSFKEIALSTSILNVFDKKYIGYVNSSDMNLDGNPSYMPGAPLSAFLSLEGRF